MDIEKIMEIISNVGSRPLASLGPISIEIEVHRKETTTLTLSNFYPFLTVADLKLAIYKELKVAPDHQFLCIQPAASIIRPVDYFWSLPGLKKEIPLVNPLDSKKVTTQAVQFVDENGTRRLLSYTGRQRLTYEELNTTVVKDRKLHLFIYEDLKQPDLSERAWNGLLYPYFPNLTHEKDAVDQKALDLRSRLYEQSEVFIQRLDSLLSDLELNTLAFSGLRKLQLQWIKGEEEPVEPIFYSTKVTEFLPYMRLMPTTGNKITKLHMRDDNTPDLADPRLLKQWTRDRSPTPNQDFIMAKALLKKGIAQEYPIYMTLRLFERGSADATIMPPKGVRKLDTTTDLTPELLEKFSSAIEDLPFATLPPQLHSATLIYGIHLPAGSTQFTKKTIRAKLPAFMPFFQEIAPLPGEQPLAMLRFKAVSNFFTEDKILAFLTQYASRKDIQGEMISTDLIPTLESEFQMTTEQAEGYVKKWLTSKGEFDVVSFESKDYTEKNNSGIDIAIFAQHPFYSFHLYNVNSVTNLERIITLMSLLFTASVGDLELSPRVVAQATAVASASASASAEAEAEAEESQEEAKEEEEGELEIQGDDQLWQQFAMEIPEEGEAPIDIAEEIKNDFVEPSEELSQVPVASVAAVAKAEEEEEGVQEEEEEEKGGIADYFLTKLKEADKRLFDYTKTHPSLKKYVSMCAANVTRQPAVVTRQQYDEMNDTIYLDEITRGADKSKKGGIVFVKYPIEKGSKSDLVKPERDYDEVFNFLEYGSTPEKRKQNLYVCSKYFCTKDGLIVLEKDFKGTEMRRPKGKKKAPNSCPFCEGLAIKNRRSPNPNETVLIRQEAPKTNEMYHTHVGFLKKTPHPEGLYLPCCFIKPQKIYRTDIYYDKLRQYGIEDAAPREEEDQEAPKPTKTLDRDTPLFPEKQYTQYMEYGNSLKYIIGHEKLPLEFVVTFEKEKEQKTKKVLKTKVEPQIGLLYGLDEYFKQDPLRDLINPKGDLHKLKDGATGFLRIAVENRERFKGDSFLAAIAPFYMLRSAKEMKTNILQNLDRQPSLFFQLNYGNFLLEFFDIQSKAPNTSELQRALEGTDMNNWDLQLPGEAQKPKERFYSSLNFFKEWLESEKTVKEYRQFASLLAQPNFLTRYTKDSEKTSAGITFIILDVDEKGSVEVRCPPYGFNPALYQNNDVAFLFHHYSGIWEPLFYVGEGSYEILFNLQNMAAWPEIVKERIQEFMSDHGCYSRGIFSYSSGYKVNPRQLIPASELVRKLKRKGMILDSQIRDAYNHLGALVFSNPDKGELIPIPCVDDGVMFPEITKIYLDWEDIKTANAKDIIEFYSEFIIGTDLGRYGDYSVKEAWVSNKRVFALVLGNGAILPVKTIRLRLPGAPVIDERIEGVEMKEMSREAMEWRINKEIVFDKGDKEDGPAEMTASDLSEIFEHLRITFANWLSDKQERGELRKRLRDTIFGDKQLYEKRKDLHTELYTTVMSWLSDDSPKGGRSTIQRVDCTSLGQESCSGRCVWSSEGQQCMLHVPETTQQGTVTVDTAQLLFFKLVEELLRFSEKRRELFENEVSRFSRIDRVITDGDQLIFPEKDAIWYELFRKWVRTTGEKGRYFEEQGTKGSVVPQEESTKLPGALLSILGETDPAALSLRLRRDTLTGLVGLLGYRVEEQHALKEDQMERISKEKQVSIAQIDLRVSPPATKYTFFSKFNPIKKTRIIDPKTEFFLLVITETGPALLTLDPMGGDLPVATQLPRGLLSQFMAKKGGDRNSTRKSNRRQSHKQD